MVFVLKDFLNCMYGQIRFLNIEIRISSRGSSSGNPYSLLGRRRPEGRGYCSPWKYPRLRVVTRIERKAIQWLDNRHRDDQTLHPEHCHWTCIPCKTDQVQGSTRGSTGWWNPVCIRPPFALDTCGYGEDRVCTKWNPESGEFQFVGVSGSRVVLMPSL